MAVRFQTFRTELRNGGLLHYFGNASGEFVADQVEDLITIGCAGLSETLAQAASKVFGTTTKDDLTAATEQLNGAEKEIAAALCAWARLHSQYFTRLR